MMHSQLRILVFVCFLVVGVAAQAQEQVRLRKKDRRRDVELVTTAGNIRLRLHDATPLHRDNFLRLVKTHYFDSILFHRVISGFMIQAGDPASKTAAAGQRLGSGGPGYTVPAEIRPDLYHHKGALAAARNGDNVNPERRSSASQFYIVQGKTFTDAQMDSLELARVKKPIPQPHRAVYKTTGGTPQLDQQYTVFGFVVKGLEVVDAIATTPVTRELGDRPVQDVRIVRARLVKR